MSHLLMTLKNRDQIKEKLPKTADKAKLRRAW
jgi:hypothetical protein